MIPLHSNLAKQALPKNAPKAAWLTQLANGFADVGELLQYLQIDINAIDYFGALQANREFKMRVPREFAAKMRPRDIHDPLLMQVLPISSELQNPLGFSADPVGDSAALVAPNLLHKYKARVLLVCTGVCAINCRYCFRREYPYQQHGDYAQALAYISANNSINEVILSGGDPLALNDNKLAKLIGRLNQIEHIKRIRIHSRMPIVLPARVDNGLLQVLQTARAQLVLVVHANHANELGHDVKTAIARLKTLDICCLNQTVLLKGVNDNLAAQCELAEALFAHGILPYYLHLLDKVRGSAHFLVKTADARQLHALMRANLSGYLLPRLVCELAGEAFKTPIY